MGDYIYDTVGIDVESNIISFFPDDTKDISFNIRGHAYQTKNKPVLVYYKKQFALKNFNEISEGMTIFRLFDKRENIIVRNFDKQALLKGISMLQTFDENEGKNKAYLYNFPKHNIEEFNEVITKLGIESHKASLNNKYIELEGESVNIYNKDKSNFDLDFEPVSFLSFLFGASLVYGDYDFDNDILRSIKMHLPMPPNVAEQIIIYDNFFNIIKDKYGIIIKYTYQKKFFGMTLQVIIDDWELLKTFMNFFDGILEIEQVSKYRQMKDFKVDIIEFLQNDEILSNKDVFLKKLNKGVLKFLVK